MGWKKVIGTSKTLPLSLAKTTTSTRLLAAALCAAFWLESAVFGAVPVDTERRPGTERRPDRPGVDCINAPSTSTGIPPGTASFILLACFEEIELRLNGFMQSSVSPGPFEQFDLALIDLHKVATDRAVRGLRDFTQQLLQGSDSDRQLVTDFEIAITDGLLLSEAAIVVSLMRASGQSAEGGAKDKGKEVQESIKKAIAEALGTVLGKQFKTLFEVIDELVRLFVKT